jgi:hypothetical protein
VERTSRDFFIGPIADYSSAIWGRAPVLAPFPLRGVCFVNSKAWQEDAMKSIGLAVLILSGALAAQTSAPAQGSTEGTAPPPRQQQTMAMQQHMQEMQAQMTKMKTKVDQMKANTANIKDPAARQQAELDAEMWQMMVDHMQSMQKMMSEHQGGMMHGGMHHMHHPGPKGTPPPSAPPQ